MKKKKQKIQVVENLKYDEEGDPLRSRFSRSRRVNKASDEVNYSDWYVNQRSNSNGEKNRL